MASFVAPLPAADADPGAARSSHTSAPSRRGARPRRPRTHATTIRCAISPAPQAFATPPPDRPPPNDEDPDDDAVYCYVACSPTRNDYLEQVLTARVYDVAVESPLQDAPLLQARLEQDNARPVEPPAPPAPLPRVMLKREDTQPGVFSFKLRGAYNMMARPEFRDALRSGGCVAASAGNHAQGVALAAERLGVRATIVMPEATPAIKVEAVARRRGVDVVLHGENFDVAKGEAVRLAEETGALFVPPFDHPAVIAGQGTVGLEILRQCPEVDAVFVPVGGGGLIAGMATVLKRLRPGVRVYGVESDEADAMARSLAAGERVKLPSVGAFADGTAVTEVGVETFRLCRELVDGVIVVSNDEVCAAIKDVFEETRSILEPAGALGVAGLKAFIARGESLSGPRDATNTAVAPPVPFPNGYAPTVPSTPSRPTYVAVTSGANTNFDRLRHVSERAEIGEGREAVFAVTIPERPGSFKRLIAALGETRSITEFNYRFGGGGTARVFVGIGIAARRERNAVVEVLRGAGFDEAVDLTDNEMAKLHVRHLVGGRPPDSATLTERVFRFEFPERRGALRQFLGRMKFDWNITMFHYRNHGTDVGRVLVGIDVPESDVEAFNTFLRTLAAMGFPATDETENPAYKLFL